MQVLYVILDFNKLIPYYVETLRRWAPYILLMDTFVKQFGTRIVKYGIFIDYDSEFLLLR